MATTQKLADLIRLEDAPKFVAPVIAPIKTPGEYERYAEDLKAIKSYCGRVEAFFQPHKQRAREAWQALVDDEKKVLKPAYDAETGIKRELTTFHTAQEELRLAEERRLQEEARKREEARRLDEAAALEREAERTGDADLREQAQQILDEPVETPSVQVGSYVPKVGGLSFRESYSAKVLDVKKLIKWVAKNIQFANLLSPNQTALNQMAKAQRENLKIDGVQAVKGKTPASGR